MNGETKQGYWTFGNLRKKVWFWLALCVVGPIIYHQEAIRGQWKFERLRKEDAGAKFYGKIEKGKGWIVENHDSSEYQVPFGFGTVAFVRYENEKGEHFDVTRTSIRRENAFGGHFDDVKYIFSPVDESKPVRYKVVDTFPVTMPDDKRFSRSFLAVIDLSDGRTLATYTSYSYQWTKPERVIFLNAPTGVGCPDDGGKSYRELTLQMGGWEQS